MTIKHSTLPETQDCFLSDEGGAITVDWVVLTAGIMLMGIVAVAQIKNDQDQIGEDIRTSLEAGAGTLADANFGAP